MLEDHDIPPSPTVYDVYEREGDGIVEDAVEGFYVDALLEIAHGEAGIREDVAVRCVDAHLRRDVKREGNSPGIRWGRIRS